MRIGLVADIHDHVEPLSRALGLFRRRGAGCVVTLGDSCVAFTRHSRAAEVIEVLRLANATAGPSAPEGNARNAPPAPLAAGGTPHHLSGGQTVVSRSAALSRSSS
jgi:hypothetical protein